MARIELRDCIVRFKDGLSGTAKQSGATGPDAATVTLKGGADKPVLNTAVTDQVPVGARFTHAGESPATLVHTVTARTPGATGPTTDIVFSPVLNDAVADDEVLTFLPQQIEIKVGDGNITYTEHRTYEYMLDRGDLDTVREGDEVPLDVKLECTYEHITTGTAEVITPLDALKGIGGAVGWVSASADPCEPYAIDIEVEHVPPCGGAQTEITLFPDFRADTKEVNFKDANIALTGKCNVIEPIINRV